MELKVGDEIFWLHGQHSHRTAKVLDITPEGLVELEGVTRTYNMKLDTLLKKLSIPYPEARCSF